MAFVSIPISQIITDVSHYTIATWRQLRDNLDGHTHEPGKGKQIPAGGIASNQVEGSKLINGAVLSKNYVPVFSQAKVASGDLSLPSSGTTEDTSLTLSFSLLHNAIVEFYYQAYQFPTGGNDGISRCALKIDGAEQTSHIMVFNATGHVLHWAYELGSGAHTIVPKWTSGASGQSVKAPRKLLAIILGR